MSDGRASTLKRIAMLSFLLSTARLAHAQTVEPAARKGIDAGNQAWVDGMKRAEATPIVATYEDNAIGCGPAGECLTGRAAIEQHIKERFALWGRAKSAQVASIGAVQQGDFVYEWGRAEAAFENGNSVVDRYLTVWRREENGSWKIFRNMVIPDGANR